MDRLQESLIPIICSIGVVGQTSILQGFKQSIVGCQTILTVRTCTQTHKHLHTHICRHIFATDNFQFLFTNFTVHALDDYNRIRLSKDDRNGTEAGSLWWEESYLLIIQLGIRLCKMSINLSHSIYLSVINHFKRVLHFKRFQSNILISLCHDIFLSVVHIIVLSIIQMKKNYEIQFL